MRKIKDRLTLGCICGLAANIPKAVLCPAISRRGISCPERAAAFFVPAKRTDEPLGKVVGFMADVLTAGLLGVAHVYMLSATGKDRAVMKGAALGAMAWYGIWGGVTSLGVSNKTRKVTPLNALATLATNIVYGASASWLVTKLGDPGLFNGEIPWVPSRRKVAISTVSVQSDDDTGPEGAADQSNGQQQAQEYADWS